jgi:SAM-dependent methyltransferase
MFTSEAAVLCSRQGAVIPLLVDRWTATPTAEEMVVLDRANAPVIDVGCGPGRHVAELAARGRIALGIDISAAATATATESGATVLRRSVFSRLPREGHWRTALLIDGNIGIGGDAARLLRRLRQVLAPGGTVLAEVDPPGCPTIVEAVRVERGADVGPWFPWARVSMDGVDSIAAAAGLIRTWEHEEAGRWFVQLAS